MEGSHGPQEAYGQSKTANIHMANQIERLYDSQGLHGLSIHPGNIATGVQTTVDLSGVLAAYQWVQRTVKDVPQCAATIVWAAAGMMWERAKVESIWKIATPRSLLGWKMDRFRRVGMLDMLHMRMIPKARRSCGR